MRQVAKMVVVRAKRTEVLQKKFDLLVHKVVQGQHQGRKDAMILQELQKQQQKNGPTVDVSKVSKRRSKPTSSKNNFFEAPCGKAKQEGGVKQSPRVSPKSAAASRTPVPPSHPSKSVSYVRSQGRTHDEKIQQGTNANGRNSDDHRLGARTNNQKNGDNELLGMDMDMDMHMHMHAAEEQIRRVYSLHTEFQSFVGNTNGWLGGGLQPEKKKELHLNQRKGQRPKTSIATKKQSHNNTTAINIRDRSRKSTPHGGAYCW